MVNDIFKRKLLHTYEQKSASRDELVRKARRALLELTREMRQGICDHPDAERMMQDRDAELRPKAEVPRDSTYLATSSHKQAQPDLTRFAKELLVPGLEK